MTWEEHEKEYGIVVNSILAEVRIYDKVSYDESGVGYSYACNLCDGLCYDFNDMMCFTPILCEEMWYCISNDDIFDNNGDYQQWILDNLL